MANQVTVTIPQAVYDRVKQLAILRNQKVADLLAEAIALVEADMATPSDEQRMAREEAAYQTMYDELKTKYAGEYVAIFNGQLIDHDSDELALLRRLDAQYPDDIVLMRKVSAEPEPDLRMRSPRLIRE
ncbi:MAG TPA: hypothetical protein DEP47_11985 [Chloroflexi bacterium]|jgi:hypothetical protein|nr:hypothetical protein [Chloroflexota bacterium]